MYLCNDCYCRFTEFTTNENGQIICPACGSLNVEENPSYLFEDGESTTDDEF